MSCICIACYCGIQALPAKPRLTNGGVDGESVESAARIADLQQALEQQVSRQVPPLDGFFFAWKLTTNNIFCFIIIYFYFIITRQTCGANKVLWPYYQSCSINKFLLIVINTLFKRSFPIFFSVQFLRWEQKNACRFLKIPYLLEFNTTLRNHFFLS